MKRRISEININTKDGGSLLVEDGMSEPKYKTALEAYKDIHDSLGYWVEYCLDNGSHEKAMKYADAMLEIEKIIGGMDND